MASSNHPSQTRYQQGEWFGVVRNGTVVLLGPDTPHALIDTVWELLASAPEAHEVLHEVTEAFGVSLSRIPPFGIIDSKDALRVFLRGDLELLVQLDGGAEKLTGRDVTTWTERRLANALSYSLRIGDGSSSLSGSSSNSTPVNSSPLNSAPVNSLPLTEGVVLLASIDVEDRESAATDPHAAHVEPVAIPTAVPVAVPAVDRASEAPAVRQVASPERVSDETMIAYSDEAVAEEPVADQRVEDEDIVSRPAPEEPGVAAPEEPAAERASEDSEVPVHTSTTDPLVPSLENTTNYDHLWDKTVMRNIEDAAVRLDEEADEHDAPATPTPSPAAAPSTPVKADEPSQGESAVGQVQAVPATGLIDSVPWLRSSPSTSGTSAAPSAVPASPTADPAPQVPAGWSPVLPPPPQALPADEDSDHDGQTIMKSSLPVADEVARSQLAAGGTEAAAVNGPSVLARVCSQGHANPPTYPQCSVCGVAISGDAVHVPRPRLGRMRLSTGELIDLDQSLIIGRQPSVSRVQGGTMPRLVQVESPGGDISRSHVEVRLEGWHVMLCDLKATNGTVLIREGQAPRRLAQNEMAILLDGDIAELGDDISLRFEEIL